MYSQTFIDFFQGLPLKFLLETINAALLEDGNDLTSQAVFKANDTAKAILVAKQDSLVVGLPLIPLIMQTAQQYQPGEWSCIPQTFEGAQVKNTETIAEINGSTLLILKAERIILNFMTHLSGIANLTAQYVQALAAIPGVQTRLLDTRKTLPGLRYPEKYAVLIGGGHNHRCNLEEMLMLKDNHIDAAGSISMAVRMLRDAYSPCPPIEVECRNLDEVKEAVNARVERIMLDNMGPDEISACMPFIPDSIETEASGGVSLENIASLAKVKPKAPDFISVGRLTHSAPVADFSLRFL